MRRSLGFTVGVVLLTIVGGGPSAQGADRPIIAVFDIEDRGARLPAQLVSSLTEQLSALLPQQGYRVIPRDQIRSRLRDVSKASYKSCFDESCQIELGRELAAQLTLATAILKIGDSCQLNSIVYELKSGTTVRSASVEAACTDRPLLSAIQTLAIQLNPGREIPPTPEQLSGPVAVSGLKVMLLLSEHYTGPDGARKPIDRPTLVPLVEDALLKAKFEIVAREQAETLRQESLASGALEQAKAQGSDARIAQVAASYGADVVVVGNAEVRHTGFNVMGDGMYWASAIVSVRAINTANAKVLSNAEVTGKTYGLSEDLARSRSIQDAGPRITGDLAARLKQAQDQEAAEGKRFQVVLHNVRAYGDTGRPFIKALKETPLVTAVRELNYGGKRLELEVVYRGNKAALMDAIFERIAILPKFSTLDKVLDHGDRIELKIQ